MNLLNTYQSSSHNKSISVIKERKAIINSTLIIREQTEAKGQARSEDIKIGERSARIFFSAPDLISTFASGVLAKLRCGARKLRCGAK